MTLLPRVADLDSFYHIGHALAYLEGSPLDTGLPWAAWSIIGERGGDLWWGFHVLLLPFAALGGTDFGIQLAAFASTLALGLTATWVLHRQGVSHPGLWAALLLVATPNIFYRHLMLRPHVLSLAASLALLSCLVRGRWWQVAALSALVSWLHLSLFWLPPAIALAYAVVRIPVTVALGRESPDTGVPIRYAIPAALGGVALGWLLRPDPFVTLSLLNAQLVQLFAQKAAGAPLTFAAELTPIGAAEVVRTAWSFTALWLVTVAGTVFAVLKGRVPATGQSRATFLFTALGVSAVFLLVALFSARRGLEQWIAFGALAMPLVWTATGFEAGRAVRWGAGVFLAVHLGWSAWRHDLNVELVAFPPNTMAEVAAFLGAESRPGELVFHARWDNFGPLFARNRTNTYLGGMDPIFQYAHDPEAFWEFFYLSVDASQEVTCNVYPCRDAVALDTHQVLTEHFGARWVVVEPRRNPRFTLYLLNDDRYRLALETAREAVFQVRMPGPGPDPGEAP